MRRTSSRRRASRSSRLARQHHFLPVAIVFDLPERLCQERNRERPDRDFGPHVDPQPAAAAAARTARSQARGLPPGRTCSARPRRSSRPRSSGQPLWNNKQQRARTVRRDRRRPRLRRRTRGAARAARLRAVEQRDGDFPDGGPVYAHPDGRKAVFVGDLVDRGPRILDSIRIARNMVAHGSALVVPGNHDMKLVRALRGRDVQITHGLDRSLAELDALPDERRQPRATRSSASSTGSSATTSSTTGTSSSRTPGMKEEMQGRGSGKVRDFALYGETTGETDEFGLPVRWNWAAEYRGQAMVVYGHTPVPEPEWLNRTINIDTGCVFGGRLTALRYPEKELVCVAVARALRGAGEAVPARGGAAGAADGAAARGRAARHRGRARQASDLDAARAQRHDPRGERDRRARGDGALRGQPEVAGLPAARRLAVRDQLASPGCSSIQPRRSRTTAMRASRP